MLTLGLLSQFGPWLDLGDRTICWFLGFVLESLKDLDGIGVIRLSSHVHQGKCHSRNSSTVVKI